MNMHRLIITLLVGSILISGPVFALEDKVVFLDVGQGDAILLQNGTKQVLVDGGKGNVVLERLAEEMPIWDKRIEVLILTHPQQDHMEGLLHVLERYDVGMVLLPDAPYDSKLQAAWLDMLTERNLPYRFAWYGQQMQVGDMNIKVLGPFDIPVAEAATRRDVNNASTMVRVDFCPGYARATPRSSESEVGSCLSFLLTGDAEAPVERMLVENVAPELLDVDVMKAGHHGSKTSNTAALLAAASPSAVAISVGENNQFGHPSPEVMARLNSERVWRTDTMGSVEFLFNGEAWFISCEKRGNLLHITESCGNVLDPESQPSRKATAGAASSG